MVATQGSGFAPTDRPRVAVASDGTLAAIHEPSRVVILELPGCAPFAELEIDDDAIAAEVAWIGTPPRLLVLTRHAAHATAHLVDPYGPRTIAEVPLDATMRLGAAIGAFALAIGSSGTSLLKASDNQLVLHPFPARSVPGAAGAAAGNFLVAVAGALEEWDPHDRIPRRRVKLPRAGAIAALGGSERVAWCTWHDEPARIDAFPVVDRGQPKLHVLPEPIEQVAAHPHSDLLVCLGAETGRIYVVDLDGRHGLRVVGPEGIERAEAIGLVVGPVGGVLAAQARCPVAVVALDGPEPAPRRPPTFGAEDGSPNGVRLEGPPTAVTIGAPVQPTVTWRDDVVAWARAGTTRALPVVPLIDTLVARFALQPTLGPALALLYAAHLAGMPGAAPVDVARVAGWDEALGRGELSTSGVARFTDSRVRIASAVRRALDELPPLTGALFGNSGTGVHEPRAIVAPREPLATLAHRLGGALLVATADADPRDVALEARAYGAAAIVVDSEAAFVRLGVARL